MRKQIWLARLCAPGYGIARSSAKGVLLRVVLEKEPGRPVFVRISPDDARRMARRLTEAADAVEQRHRPRWSALVQAGQVAPVEFYPDAPVA